MLAVDRSGTEIDATEFAPILASLVANEVQIEEGTFEVEDLLWLTELESGVAGLAQDQIGDMAQTIHTMRLSGMRRDDPELHLALEREYQKLKPRIGEEIKSAEARAASANRSAERYRRKLIVDGEAALRRKALLYLGVKSTAAGLVSIALGFLVYHVVGLALGSGSSLPTVWRLILASVPTVVLPPTLVLRFALPRYRSVCMNARSTAEESVNQLDKEEIAIGL